MEFVNISAITALHYRLFLSERSLGGIGQNDIVRLAETELGREGKILAKDPEKHSVLVAKLLDRLESNAEGWQRDCGFADLNQALSKPLVNQVRTLITLVM